MAEPLPRAGRSRPARRPARALLLIAAILTVVFSGLFMSRPASAATNSPAAQAASTARAATSARAASTVKAAQSAKTAASARTAESTKTAESAKAVPAVLLAVNSRNALLQPDGGICNVPGIGDIGSLAGLCQAGNSGLTGELNNICTPGVPQPELASSGLNSLITTPGSQPTGVTLYDHYGMAGQYWAAYGLQCSQMTSLIGNNVASMVFDMAKSLDRVTITVYQSAAGSNILTWLSSSVDTLISALGRAIYFPFLAPVVILGAIWLAWQGLIRKRATRTIEGTIWMVIACAAAIWLIGQPQDFTDVGTTVSNGVTSVLNTAFANLPADTQSNCLPIATNDAQSVTANYAFTSGSGLVDQNANELWSVLVCKPWLVGEFGTSEYAPAGSAAADTNVVNQYGRSLLFAQGVATNEPATPAVIAADQQIYIGIANKLQAHDPAVYSLFQGDQWTTRLEVGFTALFAAVAAGLLVLLIALTLIILKLGFLLLLVAGPFFLIVGIHPGFGRVVAIRWFEMLVGVLLKQVAVALVLSVLLYCYSLIMETTDQELPWALKIMMISLVTVAVFIYRKPFQHLFSSVGYGMLGANERADVSWRESAFGFRRVSATAAGTVMPGAGPARASRWARRTATDGAGGSDGTAAGTGAAEGGVRATSSDGISGGLTADSHSAQRQWPAAGVGTGRTAPPLPLPTNGAAATANGGSAGWARGGGAAAGSRGPAQPPVRTTGPMPAAPTPPIPPSRPTPSAARQPGATRTAPMPPAQTQSTPTRSTPTQAAPPFWSRSRRRPQ
jgi:hypothetical protein